VFLLIMRLYKSFIKTNILFKVSVRNDKTSSKSWKYNNTSIKTYEIWFSQSSKRRFSGKKRTKMRNLPNYEDSDLHNNRHITRENAQHVVIVHANACAHVNATCTPTPRTRKRDVHADATCTQT